MMLALASLPTLPASGDVIITLQATDGGGNNLPATLPVGTQVRVTVSLSVDEDDDPLTDVRLVQVSFVRSSPTLVVDSFEWTVSSALYGFQSEALPTPSAVSILFESDPDLLELTTTAIPVATILLTANGSGTLDVRGQTDENASDTAMVQAGFSPRVDFSTPAGNLNGGSLVFNVEGSSGTDSDNDGTPDSVDAFPTDPDETVDTDNNGIGNNADPDDDGDGVDDEEEDFPLDPAETADSDGDGIGDNADPDDDDDGVDDTNDDFPTDPTETNDDDGDGIGDNADPDTPDDRNDGPRAGGGMCGAGMIPLLPLLFFGMAGLRQYRPPRVVNRKCTRPRPSATGSKPRHRDRR